MSVIREQWKQGHGPVAEGVFYAGDSFRPARLDRQRTLTIGAPLVLPPDLDFVEMSSYESGSLQCPQGVLRWGGGPWEGEGWIALEDSSGDLVWLLHLADSEAFTQATFEGGVIEAVAHEYPMMTVFRIPVFAPHEAAATSRPDA